MSQGPLVQGSGQPVSEAVGRPSFRWLLSVQGLGLTRALEPDGLEPVPNCIIFFPGRKADGLGAAAVESSDASRELQGRAGKAVRVQNLRRCDGRNTHIAPRAKCLLNICSVRALLASPSPAAGP